MHAPASLRDLQPKFLLCAIEICYLTCIYIYGKLKKSTRKNAQHSSPIPANHVYQLQVITTAVYQPLRVHWIEYQPIVFYYTSTSTDHFLSTTRMAWQRCKIVSRQRKSVHVDYQTCTSTSRT